MQTKVEDPIVLSVMTKFYDRSQAGIKKYGTTLKDNNTDDFLTHLQEELMDAILYIEKLKDENSSLHNNLQKTSDVKAGNRPLDRVWHRVQRLRRWSNRTPRKEGFLEDLG